MNYSEFLGQVQNRARLSSTAEALLCTRATFETLCERLAGGEPKDIASQLPVELAGLLCEEGKGERFSRREFIERIGTREGVDPETAAYHARVVFEVLREAVSPGEFEDIRAQLPEDFDGLLESGSLGKMGTA